MIVDVVREEGPVDLTVYRVSFLFLDNNYKKEECRMFEQNPQSSYTLQVLPQTDKFSSAPHPFSGQLRYPDEILKGYKVFGPHFDTNKDVSINSEDRYYHLSNHYYFQDGELNESFGFRFYTSLSDCYKEYKSMPIARICEVYILGKIIGQGKNFRTNNIVILKEIKNPFRRKYKKVKVQVEDSKKPNPSIY